MIYKLRDTYDTRFRPYHSCQTALVNLIDKWLYEMNNGNTNRNVFLDFKKAFDVVDHDILFKKTRDIWIK